MTSKQKDRDFKVRSWGRATGPEADPAEIPDVIITPLTGTPAWVRRPVDVLRLILAVAILVGAQLLAALADAGVRASERALLNSVITLPPLLRDVLTGAAQLLLIVLPVVLVLALAARRRFALVGRLLLAGTVGVLAGVLDSHMLLGHSHPQAWPDLLAGRAGVFAVTFPPVAWLSGAAAILTVGGPQLSRRWRSGLWWLTGAAAAMEVIVGGFLPVDLVAATALGITVGSLVLVAFGAPISRPSAAQVVVALQECGVDLTAITELRPEQPGPATFAVITGSGASLTVRVYAADDRDRDRLVRLTRWLLVRHADNDRAGTTVESAAEHELLAMVVAVKAGARVPDPVVAYPVAGPGPHGALVAWSEVGGRRLDVLSADEISDAALADLWRSVGRLGAHRLAHRRLGTDTIQIDAADEAWVTDFVLAELGATDSQIHTDVAELLASLAVQVGASRAVGSAVAALGDGPVAAAAGLLQLLALSGPTQGRVRAYDRSRLAALSSGRARRRLRPGSRPNLLEDLRGEVSKSTHQPAAKLEPLSRFTWKRGLALLGAFAVVYLVLPQLANAGAAWRALGRADWWWIVAALPAIFVAQAFSTLLQRGAIPAGLPFGPTYLVQFGGSFLNRVTPNNVGGMALNLRYLQKAGVDTGAATGSVGLQTVAGKVADLVLIAIFFASTGRRHTAVHFGVHNRQWLFVAIALVLAAGALLGFTPRGRRFFRDKIWSFLRSAGTTIAEVAKSPHQIGLVAVGALGGPLVQITALALCVHALGGNLPFIQIGAVYLGAHLVASAAPVPGGLGALEAGLIAGLSALGMPAGAAASAVLIYRLLTYWLTIPVGWTALKVAEGRSYV